MELNKDSLTIAVDEEVQVEVTINSTDYTTLDLYYWKGENDDETYYSVTEEADIDDQHGVVTIKGLEAGEGTLIVKLVDDDEVIDEVSLPISVSSPPVLQFDKSNLTLGVNDLANLTLTFNTPDPKYTLADNVDFYVEIDSSLIQIDEDEIINDTTRELVIKGMQAGTCILKASLEDYDSEEIIEVAYATCEITVTSE